MRSPSPAFQFYSKDWLSDANVRAMTHEERGVYMDLLAICWLEDGLPDELPRLARLVSLPLRRFERLWKAIAPCFQAQGGRLSQKRLDEEKSKQLSYRQLQSEKGKKGGKSRPINKDTQPRLFQDEAAVQPDGSISVPSSLSPVTDRQTGTPAREEDSPTSATPAEARVVALSVLGPPETALGAPIRPPNPLVDRGVLVREGHALITEIAAAEDLDPTEALRKASDWNGRGYVRLDAMPDDRLAHTVQALRTWGRQIRGEPEPQVPQAPARASPPGKQIRAVVESDRLFLEHVRGGGKSGA